jgi:type IV pilus assembly protein PilA
MLARLRKAQENGEGGFTLIELLVVIIIIGILAAIAIPTFLNQRVKGWESSAKSTLKNAATAQESYFTDNSTYTATAADLTGEGYNHSADMTLFITYAATAPTVYSMCAKHTSGGFAYTLASGGAGAGAPVKAATATTACTGTQVFGPTVVAPS